MTNHETRNIDDQELLEKLVKEAAKLLPCQAPLQSFVHHNTLHNFENLPFKEALRKASKMFDSESFMGEEFFQKALNEKRINEQDISKIILQECDNCDEEIFKNGPSHFSYRYWRLQHIFTVPSIRSVDWWIHENNIFRKAHRLSKTAKDANISSKKVTSKNLKSLWEILEVDNFGKEELPAIRLRDRILLSSNLDIDELTKPVLIKLAAAYLDQGVAFNNMPQRDGGFLNIFRKLHSDSKIINETWMLKLAEECKYQQKHHESAPETIIRILHIFGIGKSEWQDFILQTLLSLKGWAGMFYQFETCPERVPISYIPAKIMDFLAVQLTLELVAAQFTLKKINSDFETISNLNFKSDNGAKKAKILQYESFISAQAFRLTANDFSNKEDVKKWHQEVYDFNDFERKYYLFLAYERHYRQVTLDAISSHKENLSNKTPSCKFQAVFCMDEREESLRRQLEEICPKAETFGFAGFFGVAMQYLGIDDVRPKPLCPVVINPNILVEEVAIDSSKFQQYVKNKKAFGKFINFTRKMRKSLLHGVIWSFFVGIFKIIPLAGRSLLPLYTAKISNKINGINILKPKTKLILERVDEKASKFGFKIGFSVAEMTDIVFSVLNSMNLKNNFSPLVIMVGHGSSSLNNPHESAYNCGATGGGKGSANARAFAFMANDKRVRENLASRNLNIPHGTTFVGAYHDTCNDSMEYYDIDLLNKNLRKKLSYAKRKLSKACNRSAQERCRRFDSVPNHITAKQAKIYVEQRAIDLAQPRPEYGHGTNAICIVGRRNKTAGLFFDRRAFLISYDPENDISGDVLAKILQAAIPVGAGISLEYYFSSIDPFNYGCNTKLPHNISGLIGVMEGAASDLRTGLPWQTVELHEPMRLLTIIEAKPEILKKIANDNPEIGRLVGNDWVQLVAWNPDDGSISFYQDGEFINHEVETVEASEFKSSRKYYQGKSEHLNCVGIKLRK
jgi:uncharacterized protein